MIILGIETSCDETAAAVARGESNCVEILSNVVASQIDIHKKYGGVVPEVAAREHVVKILPVIDEALNKAEIKRKEAKKKINAIAVTVGPGLITSLMTGLETTRVLSYVWGLPVVAVNHIEAHIYANFIKEQKKDDRKQTTDFPAVILTVSGGHTMLVLMKGHGQYETIGDTRDDAAGEAFDKAASMLGIGYPGGPAIANRASRIAHRKSLKERGTRYEMCDTRYAISLPRPMLNRKDYDFSFSGLKTALLYALKKDKDWRKRIPEYAYEFQEAVTDVLVHKTVKAAEKYSVKTVMLAGGVSANKRLREKISETVKNKLPGVELRIPSFEYTTDNAAMVAAAGYFRAQRKDFTPWQKLKVDCNFSL